MYAGVCTNGAHQFKSVPKGSRAKLVTPRPPPKAANCLFTLGLNARLEAAGVHAAERQFGKPLHQLDESLVHAFTRTVDSGGR